MHLQATTQLLLDYNAKVQAWDLNARNSVTLAFQLEDFWDRIRPIREGVGMCEEEEEEGEVGDRGTLFENLYRVSDPKN
jgi:hypothetical protein